MEDQQSDSDNLTTPDGLVPEGKAGRRKHRVPRSKLVQQADAETVVEQTPDEPAVNESAAEPEPELEPEPEPEPEPKLESEPKRSRFSWRRNKTEAVPAAEVESTTTEIVESDASESDTEAEAPVVAEDDADADSTDVAEPEPEPEPEPILVPYRTASQGLKIAAAVASVLVVGAAAFAGSMLQPYLQQRADVQIKQDVAETAAAAITSLWTYSPEDIDQLANRTARYLGGDFAAQYRDFIDSIVEVNKQAQVTNETQVVGAAVESLTPSEATAIVYTNSVSTTPNSQGFQSMRYLSYRLTLENRDRKWLITKMNDITSLDLTPQI